MIRRLFTLLSAISLLICVATVILWVRSYVGKTYRLTFAFRGDQWQAFLDRGAINFDDEPQQWLNWERAVATAGLLTYSAEQQYDAARAAEPPMSRGVRVPSTRTGDEAASTRPLADQLEAMMLARRDESNEQRASRVQAVLRTDAAEAAFRQGWVNLDAARVAPVAGLMHSDIKLRDVTLATGFLPLIWVVLLAVHRKQAQRRRLRDQCVTCGYDLRGTPDRCPECGTVPKAQPSL